MTEFDIKQALNSQLDTFLATYNIPIKDEGLSYSPKNGQPYLEITFISGDKFQRCFGTPALNRVNGIYQIDINIEADTGEGKIVEIVRALEPFFKRGTKIAFINDEGNTVNVTIQKFYVSKKVFANNPAFYSKIMNVQWQSDILN